MLNKNLILLILTILFFTSWVNADMAPESGRDTRVNLIIQTEGDVSDYLFFFEFSGDLRQVQIKSNDKTVLPPMGGGARYRSGEMIAIPKDKLKDLENNLSFEQISNLSKQISSNKIEGVVKLLRHSFIQNVSTFSFDPPSPIYKLERDGNTIKAIKISEETEEKPFFIIIVIASGLIALAILVIGVFVFRKMRRAG